MIKITSPTGEYVIIMARMDEDRSIPVLVEGFTPEGVKSFSHYLSPTTVRRRMVVAQSKGAIIEVE